ncbi:MAG: enoyl-CoA hydratase/isomerase family protein [archaeon]|nr:enoyl-CoA hydratase/isomerase family protein [archaeon]
MAQKESKYEHILVEKNKEGNYVVITMNRPNKLNALANQTLNEIVDALEEINVKPRLRCVVLRGTPNFTKKPSFSAGADLSSGFGGKNKKLKLEIPMHQDISMNLRLSAYQRIAAFSKPLIAAVDGFALGGGCELTLCCDIVIATKRSFFGFPEVHRGLFPANGGTQKMVDHIGLARTRYMILTGERIPAETMEKWGYIAKLVNEGDEFEKEVHELASFFGNGPTTAFFVAKKAINFGTQVPLNIGLQFESMGHALNTASKDLAEGVTAFIEKRKPVWKGK